MIKRVSVPLGMLLLISLVGCPSGTTDGAGGGTDITAGQSTYQSRCAVCHLLGTFDTSGFAPNLVGRQDKITADFVFSHTAVTLSDADVGNLQAFIAAQE